ncbi:MAG: ATP-binding cassette domain-containing protein [Candidatus Caldarchaeum sp.]|nr:ATP-binding cassette domain-containing protein [Candidatus Caldarchaeum sp.]MDW7978580.1 ATP-binding cassette domain-containing protein [Candidatus Caldarchaeum sp.]
MFEAEGLVVERGGFRISVDRLRVDDRVVLLGRNGSGKTTLLKCFAGFIRPSKGRLLLNGEEITNLSPSMRRIGYIPQEPVRLPLKPSQVVEFFARKFSANGLEILNKLGISYILDKEALSQGESQIVNLAVVMMRRPELLLLDEPTANLDYLNQVGFWRVLRTLPTPMVYVTHDPLEASLIADHIYLVEDGSVRGPYSNPLRERAELLVEDFNLYKILQK